MDDRVVVVTFIFPEADDLDHPSGVTEETYNRIVDAISNIGGEDIDIELTERD